MGEDVAAIAPTGMDATAIAPPSTLQFVVAYS